MNILVTGGAGYIGSHVVLELCEKGYKVIVLDDLSLGSESSIDKRAEFILGSTHDKKLLSTIMNDIEAVIHLAAFKAAGESMNNPTKYSFNNIAGSISLIDSMLKHNTKKMIFSSTAAVYGEPLSLPIDENHPTNPINYYGFTKLKVEEILQWYSKINDLKSVSLRYFNAAGYDKQQRVSALENNPQNLIPIVMECAAGIRSNMEVFGDDYNTHDGTCLRDYIHVSDLAKAHVSALEYLEDNSYLTTNLGTGDTHSVYDVINMAKAISGKNINYITVKRRSGDPSELYASSILAKDTLNWSATHSSLKNIIETTWSMYQNLNI